MHLLDCTKTCDPKKTNLLVTTTRKPSTNNPKKSHIAMCIKMTIEIQRHMTHNKIK